MLHGRKTDEKTARVRPMIGWLDLSAGASGDMLLGALVDAGVPLEVLADAVAALPVERILLTAEPDAPADRSSQPITCTSSC